MDTLENVLDDIVYAEKLWKLYGRLSEASERIQVYDLFILWLRKVVPGMREITRVIDSDETDEIRMKANKMRQYLTEHDCFQSRESEHYIRNNAASELIEMRGYVERRIVKEGRK